MTSVLNKLGAHLNKSLSDPDAEKAYRDQQAASKAAIKKWKAKFNDRRSLLSQFKLKHQIYPTDVDMIEIQITAAIKYLDGAGDTEAEDIESHMQDTYGEPFEDFWSLAVSSDAGQSTLGDRFQLWRRLDTYKQTARDNPKAPQAVLAELTTLQQEAAAFLRDNTQSTEDAYAIFVQKQLNTLNNSPVNAELAPLLNIAETKVAKNKGLDFQETDDFNHKEATAAQIAAKAVADEKMKDEFSVTRLLGNATSYILAIALITLFIFICMIGSSMAVNLNIYKSYPYKILYTIYGFLFAIIVVPYVVGYRWLYKGKRPKYYGFLPFIPRYFTNHYVQMLFGWLTYRPDEHIWDLQEWRNVIQVPAHASA